MDRLYSIKTRNRQAGSYVVVKKAAQLDEVFDFIGELTDEDIDVVVQIYNPKNKLFTKKRKAAK